MLDSADVSDSDLTFVNIEGSRARAASFFRSNLAQAMRFPTHLAAHLGGISRRHLSARDLGPQYASIPSVRVQAVVSGSDMSRADFRHADLLGARFDAGSKLGCTDLTGALYGTSGGRSPWPCRQFDPLDTGRDEELGVSSVLRQSPRYPCLADPCDAGNKGKGPAGRSPPPSSRPPPPPGSPQPPQTSSSEVGSWSFIDGVYTWTGVKAVNKGRSLQSSAAPELIRTKS